MKRRGRRLSGATIFFALLSLALAIILYVQTRCPAAPRPAPSPTPSAPRPAPTARRRTAPPPPAPRPVPTAPGAKGTPPSGAARAAIVIDDLGNELGPAERIARWKEPVAGAVLPGVACSAAAARALARGGKEVLLHLPMEPEGYPRVRPGPGVILRSQSDDEIVRVLDADLATVPGAAGVNNHMGSAATADVRVMRVVARVLAAPRTLLRRQPHDRRDRGREDGRGGFGPLGLAPRLPGRRRDGGGDPPALAELVRRATEEGDAVAIGHPYPATLEVLEEELPGLAARGVKLVRVGELVR